jgi:hypothetical protein
MDVNNLPPSKKWDETKKNFELEAKEDIQLYLNDKKLKFEKMLEEDEWDAEWYMKDNKDLRLIMRNWNQKF